MTVIKVVGSAAIVMLVVTVAFLEIFSAIYNIAPESAKSVIQQDIQVFLWIIGLFLGISGIGTLLYFILPPSDGVSV
ncbi:MAG: hypothetical protein J7K61_05455 [Thermoplasmata archaeon]|nr:hypothetical protein [Thermoplasmata archaeon]